MPGPLERILAVANDVVSADDPGRGPRAARIAQLVRNVLMHLPTTYEIMRVHKERIEAHSAERFQRKGG